MLEEKVTELTSEEYLKKVLSVEDEYITCNFVNPSVSFEVISSSTRREPLFISLELDFTVRKDGIHITMQYLLLPDNSGQDYEVTIEIFPPNEDGSEGDEAVVRKTYPLQGLFPNAQRSQAEDAYLNQIDEDFGKYKEMVDRILALIYQHKSKLPF